MVANITHLPCEMVLAILSKLDDVQCLQAATLTCRYFHSSLRESPSIIGQVLGRQLTRTLIPYAIAALDANTLPRPLNVTSAKHLIDTLYKNPDKLEKRIGNLDFAEALRLGHVHNVIRDLALDLMSRAWSLLSSRHQNKPLVLSDREYLRVCRSFYQVHLFWELCCYDASLNLEDLGRELLFRRNRPWENEQLACVHDYLEQKFSEATFDVLAHDIEFEELGRPDDIQSGEWLTLREHWMSFGVLYINSLINEASYEGKRDKLHSVLCKEGGGVIEMSLNPRWDEEIEYNGTPLQQLNDEERDTLLGLKIHKAGDQDDPDEGPFQAWSAAHGCLRPVEWTFSYRNSGRRRRAYVLWDADRISRYSLPDAFEDANIEDEDE